MAEGGQSAVIDIETELTCPICTELLYQPLTLLDCLHTYCGSCLKEWFTLQASTASSGKVEPLKCPTCRAPVRETRPNATVTTLLDMYLRANPGKVKASEEKEAIARTYKPGDNVLPKLKRRKETTEEVEDRRMVEEVQQMSMRDVGIRGAGYERGVRHHTREEQDVSSDNRTHRTNVTATDVAARAGQIGHQNSLRSIISSSDLGDSTETQEEIMKQIMDDGILDGIDLNHLSAAQEEELTEKIAEAYKRRHRRRRSREREQRPPRDRDISHEQDPAAEQQRERKRQHPPNHDASGTASHPKPRAHLLSPAYPVAERRTRRHSHETRRQTSPAASTQENVRNDAQRQAARSATDLSDRPSSSSMPAADERPKTRNVTRSSRQSNEDGVSRSHRSPPQSVWSSPSSEPAALATTNNTSPRPASDRHHPSMSSPQQSVVQSPTSLQEMPLPHFALQANPEPSITCGHCNNPNLQYNQHWNCPICDSGSYNVCNHCYLTRHGCHKWGGFRFPIVNASEHATSPSSSGADHNPTDQDPLHRLIAQRYLPPCPPSDPQSRLQSGLFCSNCSAFTPDHYWACDTCNEGEWGFCNKCVNTAQCCTHALLPLSSIPSQPPHSPPPPTHTSPPTSPRHHHHQPQQRQPTLHPLQISTSCNSCANPIPPSVTRYHCPKCQNGDYDLCQSCYHKAVKRGTIPPHHGPKGWRKCAQGHRMQVIGFEDSEVGQRRIVVQDLVGGVRAEEEDGLNGSREVRWWEEGGGERRVRVGSHTAAAVVGRGEGKRSEDLDQTQPMPMPLSPAPPPSGGRGMCMLAVWSYWPEGEMGFPRGAEIRECEDLNGDWFEGVYCGKKGLFPASYGRVLGRV